MKWVPALLWPMLPPRAAAGGLVFLAGSMLLSLAMLPLTIIQLQVLFGFGARPLRADYLVFVWSAVPWWWRLRDPFAFLRLASRGARPRGPSWHGPAAGPAGSATTPRATATRAWARLRVGIRRTVGLEDRRRRDRFAEAAIAPASPDEPPIGGEEAVRPPLPDLAPADRLAPGEAARSPGGGSPRLPRRTPPRG